MCRDCVFFDIVAQKRLCHVAHKTKYEAGKCEEALPAAEPEIAKGIAIRQIDPASGKWEWFIEGALGLPSVSIEKISIRQRVHFPYDDPFNVWGQYN